MKKAVLATALLGLSGLLAACGGGSSSVSAKKTTAKASTTSAPATVKTATTSLGTVLVASDGRTLYAFANDTPTMSNCTAACAQLWPPLTVTGKPIAGSGVDQSMLTVLNGPNGAQVEYAGHPLYEFAQDAAPGDVKGQGFAGNLWHVLSATGQIVTTGTVTPATAPPATAPPATSAPATAPPATASPPATKAPSNMGGNGSYGY